MGRYPGQAWCRKRLSPGGPSPGRLYPRITSRSRPPRIGPEESGVKKDDLRLRIAHRRKRNSRSVQRGFCETSDRRNFEKEPFERGRADRREAPLKCSEAPGKPGQPKPYLRSHINVLLEGRRTTTQHKRRKQNPTFNKRCREGPCSSSTSVLQSGATDAQENVAEKITAKTDPQRASTIGVLHVQTRHARYTVPIFMNRELGGFRTLRPRPPQKKITKKNYKRVRILVALYPPVGGCSKAVTSVPSS